MKIKILIISFFVIALVSLCSFELIYSQKILNEINNLSNEIIYLIDSEDEQSNNLTEKMNDLYSKWNEDEHNLCLLYNHKDLLEIGKEINQALSYILIDNVKESYVHMLLLKEDLETLIQIVGFNTFNIF